MNIPPKVNLGARLPAAMSLRLNGYPANPLRCLFQGSGPDRTSPGLRLRPPASPFGPAFSVNGEP
jgi:hypothetical protein